MAKKSWIARQKKRERLVAKYAELRKELKNNKDWAALSRLPRNSSPTRLKNRCSMTGRAEPNGGCANSTSRQNSRLATSTPAVSPTSRPTVTTSGS